MEIIIIFLCGLVSGIAIQKYIGINNLLDQLWQKIDQHIISRFKK